MNSYSKQITLKPQDLLIALKIALNRDIQFSFAQLSGALGMSASEAHASTKRCKIARLLTPPPTRELLANTAALREFLIHGARYAFPASTGAVTRGIPTGSAVTPLSELLVETSELPFVWPTVDGAIRGVALTPIFPSVPLAVAQDLRLYEALTLLDAIRIGSARERELAARLLEDRL